MKKKILAKVAPLLALVLTACGTRTYEPKDYILELPWKENFKILQFNDTHIGNKDDQELQFAVLTNTIKEAGNPDLIVFCGDVFTFADRITVRRMFNWLDSQKINWTLTWGNHDEQAYYSIDWITGYLNDLNALREKGNNESYCVFKDLQDDDIMGNANFAINLMKDGKAKEQVIIMDSNRYNFGQYKDYDSYTGYDAFHEEQVTWYKNLVSYTTEKNGGTPVPSTAFFHIPLPEYKEAKKLADAGDSSVTVVVPQTDRCPKGEGVASPKINTGMFDAMVEGHSTNGVFVAHDHKNTWAIEYKGITLSFGINSTDRVYLDQNVIGGQTITFNDDGTFVINQIIHGMEVYEEAMKK